MLARVISGPGFGRRSQWMTVGGGTAAGGLPALAARGLPLPFLRLTMAASRTEAECASAAMGPGGAGGSGVGGGDGSGDGSGDGAGIGSIGGSGAIAAKGG
jgi:hypothetical protein